MVTPASHGMGSQPLTVEQKNTLKGEMTQLQKKVEELQMNKLNIVKEDRGYMSQYEMIDGDKSINTNYLDNPSKIRGIDDEISKINSRIQEISQLLK
jgi:predicted transcriptional regulator